MELQICCTNVNFANNIVSESGSRHKVVVDIDYNGVFWLVCGGYKLLSAEKLNQQTLYAWGGCVKESLSLERREYVDFRLTESTINAIGGKWHFTDLRNMNDSYRPGYRTMRIIKYAMENTGLTINHFIAQYLRYELGLWIAGVKVHKIEIEDKIVNITLSAKRDIDNEEFDGLLLNTGFCVKVHQI